MRVREASYEDHREIMDVARRNGMPPRDYDDWVHVWEGNPARDHFQGFPIGWILEDGGGRAVGTLWNLPLACEIGGRMVTAAVAGNWVVDPEHRNGSLGLVARYFRQKNVDVLLNTSAAPVTAKVVTSLFQAARVPHDCYDEPLIWVTEPAGFARAMLARARVPMAKALAWPAGCAVSVAGRLRGCGARRGKHGVRRAADFDGRFDAFWAALREGPERLRPLRDRASLAWHFALQRRKGTLRILTLEAGATLAGYMVLMRRDSDGTGLRRYHIADLQALDDDPDAIRRLGAAALELSAEEGIGAVEAYGFAAAKRRALEGLRPYRRKLASWPYFVKVQNRSLAEVLSRPEAWDPMMFDGDDTL